MKKTVFFILILLCAASIGGPKVYSDGISAKSAIVYEPFSKTVLYEKSADEQMLVASTTKIMTALVVIENCSLDEKVNVNAEHAAVEGSSMYLKPGGDYTVEDLLHGLMLASGNDAAAALADHTAGSMENFASLMNEKCRELNLGNTHFANAHGLDAEGHYSSARDLALITASAMENDVFCRVFSCPSYTLDGNVFYNHNKLLELCPGCIGGKTGYTKKAGRVLVSCVERENMTLICVTVSAPDDWEDHIKLYNECFEKYEYISLDEKCSSVPVFSGTKERSVLAFSVPGIVAEKIAHPKISFHIPRFVFAPVKEGEKLGHAEVYRTTDESLIIDIFFGESIPQEIK